MISVCIITKNEAVKLERCLASIKKADPHNTMEIVVVDTGSTDDTIELARKYTDRVYEFAWCNHFAKARNYSVEKANGEYILVLDSDEYIKEFDVEALLHTINEHDDKIGRIHIINEHMRNGELVKSSQRVSRFFKKELYHYEGRIHEQLVLRSNENSLNETLRYETFDMPISVFHDGYDGDVTSIKMKAERNRKLLLLDLEEAGEDPYVLYQLGQCDIMVKNYARACEYYGRALAFDLNPKLEYVQNMVESYGYALLNSGQAELARDILGSQEVYEAFSNSADYCFMMGIVYMNCADFQRAVTEFEKATCKPAMIEGVDSYKAYYNIAVIYECIGRLDEAKVYYNKCGGYELAKKRIEQMK